MLRTNEDSIGVLGTGERAQSHTDFARRIGVGMWLQRVFVHSVLGDDAGMRRLSYQQLSLEYERYLLKGAASSDLTPHPVCPDACASWDDVFKLESIVVACVPAEVLRQKLWRLRLEYRRLASVDLFRAYLRSQRQPRKKMTSTRCVLMPRCSWPSSKSCVSA